MVASLFSKTTFSGGGSALSNVFTDNYTTTTPASSWSIAKNIGTPATNRKVVVAVVATATASTPVSSVVIGGVSAVKVSGSASSAAMNQAEIWYATVPSGTSATVVVTFSGSVNAGSFCVYSVYNSSGSIQGSTASGAATMAGSITGTGPFVSIGVGLGVSATNQRVTSLALTSPTPQALNETVAVTAASCVWTVNTTPVTPDLDVALQTTATGGTGVLSLAVFQ